jgi:hypothetical protein
MKLLILLASIFTATASHAMISPVGRSTALDYAGAVISSTVEKHFINVKAGAAHAAGTAVVLDLTADDGATVTTSAAAGQSPLCIIVTTCVSGKICKCQKYGLMDAALFDSTNVNAVAGSRWYMSTVNAGYLQARTTSLATEVPGGIFYDAATASGTIQVFIDL